MRVALRSSAIGEDSELSFAGQYLSILNVSREKLVQGYTMVVASLYTPRAISYRLNKGIRDEDIAMSVACLELIDSVASGVMYSRHPFKPTDKDILINAVWGLGPYAVDGVVTPDTYRVSQNDRFNILVSAISTKSVRLIRNPEGGLKEAPVAEDLIHSPCLSPEQISTLAGYAQTLERHYQPAPGHRVGPGPRRTPAAAAIPAPAGAVVFVGGTPGLFRPIGSGGSPRRGRGGLARCRVWTGLFNQVRRKISSAFRRGPFWWRNTPPPNLSWS